MAGKDVTIRSVEIRNRSSGRRRKADLGRSLRWRRVTQSEVEMSYSVL